MSYRRSSQKHTRSSFVGRMMFSFLEALKRLTRFFLVMMIVGLFAGITIIWYFSRDLPRIDELFHSYRRPCIRIFDKDNTLLATYGDVYGDMISVNDLPEHVSHALMAVEDKRFYSHFGIDFTGILRAFWTNYQSGRVVQGGSTITQQLGKNILQAHKIYGPTDRSLRRKIQETILALLLETKLTKTQIMTLYLNRVYFGAGAFGVDAAAKRYFGRSAKTLTLYESAMLMGLLKAPSRYSPAQNPHKSENRTRQVLLKMVEAGFINEAGMKTALLMASPPPDVTNTSSIHYFTDWVVDHLRDVVSLNQDLNVWTTIDLKLQALAEKTMQDTMKKWGKKWGADQMALLSITPDGAVKAMLGGMDYAKTKFNRVTQALRQPGSLFKFFTYLTALKEGLAPDHHISDGPVSVGHWSPKNYRYTAQGMVTLRDGFAKSINTMAVRLAMMLGITRVIETARLLGVTSPIPHNLSIALGSSEMTLLELTGAFATIANQGLPAQPYGIQKITDRQGHVLYQHQRPRIPILAPSLVDDMTDLLVRVVTNGTGRRTQLDRPSACKTGTSQNYRDLWLIGFTPELVTGTWTGRDSDQPMNRQGGGSPSSHLWREFMKAALAKTPKRVFKNMHDDQGPVETIAADASAVSRPDQPQQHNKTLDDLLNQSALRAPARTPPKAPPASSDQSEFGGWETPSASSERSDEDVTHFDAIGHILEK
ncbi:transglycosylase domain-containing protein [Candidatus Hepatobacter penaei]|uniref:transglycosylase domain-containing protein n=1 Tax=Candidatus Hepatobacter penaei TaxID=1274402 RepID=UPI0006974B48|nr:PBP1A family penicillin-binding protein [Candidatus Hepatobacter penaei]